METREARDGYTIFTAEATDDGGSGYVVQQGDSYLVDGRLIYHADYQGEAYPSAEVARAAVLAYQGDTDPAAGPTYPADQWPGYGRNYRHFRATDGPDPREIKMMSTLTNASRDLGSGYSWSPRRAWGRITFPAVLKTPDGREVISTRTFKGIDTAGKWAETAMRADARRESH